MKQTLILTITALILFLGCTPQDALDAIKATLDGKSIATITFSATNGDAKTIDITCTMAWELTKKPSWLTVNPTSGEGSKKVIITVNQANSSTTKRDGELIFQSAKGNKLTIKVSQQGTTPPITLTTNATQTAYADQTAGAAIKFTTTGNWSAALSLKTKAEAPLDWISINPKSGVAGSHTLTVTLQPNYTGADRTAVITITSGTDKAEATVTQKGTKQDGKPLTPPTTGGHDVYIFGSRGSGSSMEYGYWKNGNWVKTNTVFEGGEIQQVVVSDNNLYLVRNTGAGNKTAVWKNWVKILEYDEQVRIAVSGNDVYAVDKYLWSSYTQSTTYWKNNQKIKLPTYTMRLYVLSLSSGKVITNTSETYDSAILCDIAVDGSNISISSDVGYWRNGKPHMVYRKSISHINELESHQGGDMLNDYSEYWSAGAAGDRRKAFFWSFQYLEKIVVSGAKTYILTDNSSSKYTHDYISKELDYNRYNFQLSYWLNDGTNQGAVVVEDGLAGARFLAVRKGKYGDLMDIAVANGDVHVVGYLYDNSVSPIVYQAVHWKNGQKNILGESTGNAWGKQVRIAGNDVYILGLLGSNHVVWKNGTIIFEKSGNYPTVEIANHIAILPHDPARQW